MTSPHASRNSAMEPHAAPVRILCLSAAVAATSLALCIAEQHGFRIFDESLRDSAAAIPAILSPLEVLTLLGIISFGVIAAVVSIVTSVTWLVRHLRQLSDAATGPACPQGETGSPAQNAGCQP